MRIAALLFLAACVCATPTPSSSTATSLRVRASDALPLLVLKRAPAAETPSREPLLLVHGSMHAAWCWDEGFMQVLADRGHPCFALSLRGTLDSGVADPSARSVRITEHVSDVRAVLEHIQAEYGGKVSLLAHSFGRHQR